MAKTQTTSSFTQRMAAKIDAAVKAHAGDETNYGLQRLPGGINAGIAKLTACGFEEVKPDSKFKKWNGKADVPAVGEYYFRAAAVVVSPESVIVDGNPIVVKGLQTSIMEPMFDTRTAKGDVIEIDQHISNVMNELRKLGIDTNGATGANLEAMCQALKQQAPYFRFSTRQSAPTPQYPNPRVFEQWDGIKGLEGYVPEDAQAGAVEDATDEEIEPEGVEVETPDPKKKGKPAPEPEEFDEFGDLDSLAAKADDGDEKAQAELEKQAKAAGVPGKKIKSAATWAAVADMVKELTEPDEADDEPPADEEAEEAEEEEAEAPEVGQIVKYKSAEDKKAQPAKIVYVNEKKRTVDLRPTANPKALYKSVPWDELSD